MAETTSVLKIILEAADRGVEQVVGKARGALSGLGSMATGVAAGGLGLAAGAIIGLGAASFDVANDLDIATANMQSSLGLTAEEAERFGGIALGVFGDNFAGSVEEAGAAVIETRTQLRLLSDEELKSATENAIRFTDVFGEQGADMETSLNAANVLMEQFGLTQDQAFDFMTTGFQRGLNSSGDFLDSISEYGGLFGQSGATAGQFFSLLETGLAGGVLGTDKAADAFKEYRIRFLEGGDDISEAFGTLGVDYGQWIEEIESGELTTAEAFDRTIGLLNDIEDPIARNKAGVALMGTQFEDMGADAIAALDLSKTKLQDTAGASEALNTKYDTLGSAMEGLKRQALVALAPIGGILLDGVNAAMPGIQTAVDWFTTTAVPKIQEFAETAGQWIATFIERAKPIVEEFSTRWDQTLAPAMLLVKDALQRISEALGIATGDFSVMDSILWGLNSVLDAVIFGVQAGAIAFQGVAWAVEQVSAAVDTAVGLWDQLGDIIAEAGDQIPEWMIPGSPPPLYYALQDINKALTDMPDVGEAMGFDDAPRDPFGPGGGGAGLMAGVPARERGQTVFNITIEANDEAGGKRAGSAFVDELRSRGVLVGV